MDVLDIKTVPEDSIIYENDNLYICLAHNPLTPNHTIVAWKDKIEDIHALSKSEFTELMNAVEAARDALLVTYSLEKVYLIYADEARHVHWHLVPRYVEKGMSILNHEAPTITDFSNAQKIAKNLNLT